MDFILEAGDIFYLPRGWWHNPLPIGEETFHLAVGTFPAYAIDYAQWALQQLPEFVSARKSLHDWEQDRQTVASLGQHLDAFLNDPDNYRRFMDEFMGATRLESPLAIDLFGNPACGRLVDDVPLRLSANRPHGLADGYVIANGTKLNLDVTGARLIACIAASPGIRLGEVLGRLSDLDSGKLRSLIQQLCHQDVLELARH